MQLKENGVKYSPNERRMFDFLGARKKSSSDLLADFYGRTAPFNGRKIVVGLLSSLRRKIALNREPFRLMATPRRGPHAMEFWLEKKK